MINKNNKIGYSIEIFPPKETHTNLSIIRKINDLTYKPDFISVTYGAGGTSRERTYNLVKLIHTETDVSVAAHLTCVGSSIDETISLIDDYIRLGIKKIVALRGDSNQPDDKIYKPHPLGFQKTSDLICNIKKLSDIELYVAGYPEKHPESKKTHDDILNLKGKLDSGGDFIITQYFFENSIFYNFQNILKKYNIKKPIIPGVIPIVNYDRIKDFSERCGASIPERITKQFLNQKNSCENKNHLYDLATKLVVEQSLDLIRNKISQIHIYSLNQITLVDKIWCNILEQYNNDK
tara:strand:- start:21180 stop:22058 length:879 start_codon:yes stop_codon:yes gene_type:complete